MSRPSSRLPSSRFSLQHIDPVLRLAPPSPLFSLIGMLIGCGLIAVATWLGGTLHGERPIAELSVAAQPLRVVDAQRALIFMADKTTGDVRVLNVRGGVSEIARLHEGRRQDVVAMTLDTQRKVLTVDSVNERYAYDTQTFRLLTRSPVLAAGQTGAHDL